MSASLMADLPLQQEAIRARCFHPRGTFVEFREEEIEQSIPDRFEQMVRKYPDRLAVKTKSHHLTYDELNREANRVAHALLAQHGEREEPVALLLEKGAPAIAAMLGVLKAGKFYVVLDPSYPPDRVLYMLQDSLTRLIVTNNYNLSLASELVMDGIQTLNIDQLDARLPEEDPGLSISPDALSWVVYTSGSTGYPKGVVQNHRNALQWVRTHTDAHGICADDRLSFVNALSAGIAARDIFGSLLNGATLFPYDVNKEGLHNLANWLIREEITVYYSVATIFRHFLSTVAEDEKFPKLRLVRLGAEAISRRDVELYKKHCSSECILVIGLGITEVGWVCRYYMGKDSLLSSTTVPVGYPGGDVEEVLLLGDDGREIGPGEVGEIAAKSRYLAVGYWQRPDLTKKAFLPDPNGGDQRIYLTGDMGLRLPDGCLVHMGRKDSQVKIRGNRVELTEIETALLSLDNVQEAVAVAQEDPSGDQRIVAYLVANEGPLPSSAALRRSLRQRLPNYMVPSAFVALDALPLLPSGKADRRSLAALHALSPGESAAAAAPAQASMHLEPASQERTGLPQQNKANSLPQRVFRALSGLVLHRSIGRK